MNREVADLVSRGAGRVRDIPEAAEVAAAVAAVLAFLGEAGPAGDTGFAGAARGEPRVVPAGAGDAGGTGFRLWSLAGRQQQMGARLHVLRAARRSRGRADG